ncbi:MAG: molybdopterin-guanine dinucleotide biosynthesis protein B [Gemmatimonadetes bacterium]|nr:molybdopterin-guanine dinucleotide biosynthesis protein B [Gemmatimonadota bacterium]NIR81509.1 molybdopterin-guanine dinucleotide biosynthesis protein B [Gemmatimonadota bacterium]NIT90354.1 molybdopterin-guanine dinucleotide biosynthesis protein B [Gemmatimonadota bacterium]NIU34181.1 molybdopterin-guanine dinucleotide biosynthesis protein B [Gemmatimonadota bacterium]NIU38327.1 molybdopterin-guanine dinucleotide biosynthesis protein B [Gemmatimonadota bacterium]
MSGPVRPPPILCVVGKKDSGKTTLVVGLVAELVGRGRRVMTIKHGHGFELDREGTDSWRHRHEGGALRVALAGPDQMAVQGGWGPEGEPGPEEIAARFLDDAELVVAEGYKGATLPKVEVHRAGRHASPVYAPDAPDAALFVAFVTDRPDVELPLPVFDLTDPELIPKLTDLVEASLLGGR